MVKPNRQHLFISHHHADDKGVTKLTDMLKRDKQDVRNSSIRAFKPKNQERWKNRQVKDETIRRLLRRKISWASTVVVLIGKDTASRPWVNWEIAEANRQGKKIVGVFEQGGTENDVPSKLEDYGSALVAWNTKSIVGAIDGGDTEFQNPDGSIRSGTSSMSVSC